MLAQEVIRHKREGNTLTKEEIEFFINGIIDWSISECQIASFVMAVCLRGLNDEELGYLTRAMAFFGNVLSWDAQALGGPVLDKLSTGGLGDKTTLILAPILASCGAFVPIILNKSVGYASGVVNKLASIPGYNISPSFELLHETVQTVGCAVIVQSSDLSPATKRLLSVLIETATLDCVEFMAASVLARKIATGAQAFVFDIKCDEKAIYQDLNTAKKLADTTLRLAEFMGLPTRVAITDMSENIGTSIGNTLEIKEALDFLKGTHRNKRLERLVKVLASEGLLLTGLAASEQEAERKIDEVLSSGKALEKFSQMITKLGAPEDFIQNAESYLPKAPIIRPVFSKEEGYLYKTNIEKLVFANIALGGIRTTAEQKALENVGFSELAQIGDKISKDKPLAFIHAQNEQAFQEAETLFLEAIEIAQNEPERKDILYQTLHL